MDGTAYSEKKIFQNKEEMDTIVNALTGVLNSYKIDLKVDGYEKVFAPLINALSECAKDINQEALNDSLKVIIEAIRRQEFTYLNAVAVGKLCGVSDIDGDIKEKMQKMTRAEAGRFLSMSNLDYGKEKKYKIVNGDEISDSNLQFVADIADTFDGISENDILLFSQLLKDTPYMAAMSQTGKKIFELCHHIPEYYTKTIPIGELVYRGRKLEDQMTAYTESEIREAPYTFTGQGRFNLQGIGYFYAACSKDLAIREVKKHLKREEGKIQIGEFRTVREMTVLDLKAMNNAFSEKCLREVGVCKEFNIEYLFPAFVAQCLVYQKAVDGIEYGTNEEKLLVTFNSHSFEHMRSEFSIL